MEGSFKVKNILFIIPHPDDEIVGACIIIRRFLLEGKKIHFFFITNGVLSKDNLWFWQKKQYKRNYMTRRNEMYLSMKELGVTNFSYQDVPTRTLKEIISETHSKIKQIISLKKIDTIFCPAYEGGHQDHDVANYICSKFSDICDIYEFPEYNFYKMKINCNTFIDDDKNQNILELTDEEKKFKSNCLKVYRSEKKNLNYITIHKESFRPIKKYDYSKPPHAGVLFYRRYRFFSWHPRVDQDDPLLICKRITQSKIFS